MQNNVQNQVFRLSKEGNHKGRTYILIHFQTCPTPTWNVGNDKRKLCIVEFLYPDNE